MLTFFLRLKLGVCRFRFVGCSRWPEGICQGFPKKYDLERSGNVEIFQANPKGLQALTLYPKAGFLRPKKGIGTPGSKTTGGRFGDGKDTPETLRKRKKDSPVCEAIP
ncbi:hypothetical protein CS546_00805 [Porphyromonas gingivalis]|nr:hypothetical protein CS546_00805 [Porphyromonas gingivalis]ATR96858.1 hypothetical protein CS548_07180 [Porphyromonas gingivalis]